ncbi:cuticlin-6 [Halyomorpha halys]|uniref:cuticlin-6 n=1 Tax=Halyomorpha halys TaxID=286706 RepID=UPI0006D4F620|nr:uncharacterized protein LOC106692707 [Halyomorpha halys]
MIFCQIYKSCLIYFPDLKLLKKEKKKKMKRIFVLFYLLAFAKSQENFTMEDSALFFRMEPGDTDPETDKSVQNIISWLQKRYNFGQRKVRNEMESANAEYESGTLEPRPFGFIQTETTSPTPEVAQVVSSTSEPVSNNEVYPPQVTSLNVLCQKDKMTVDIEFSSTFNGIIYSKDHYTSPECRYVVTDSQSSRYRFTVQLNSCGTQFVNEFDKGGQAYLENVLVIQNEPGILEIWDSVRSVRCLWEGSIRQSVTSGLSVVTPSTELVTFSGDTATARLEIQTGRGPFANAEPKPANIGDMMTLVVKVEGDPDHQIRVGRCMANGGGQELQLSDDAGCPLRPKLMSAFEYTRSPDTNSAIAFSYFRAFKFPDSNELNFDCNVELCKKPCVPCQENGLHHQWTNRNKRSFENNSSEQNNVFSVKNSLWMMVPQPKVTDSKVCVTTSTFYMCSFAMLLLMMSTITVSLRLYLSNNNTKGRI